jgi:hypothetical protein
MRPRFRLATAWLLSLALLLPASASGDATFNVQGRLIDAAGQPVTSLTPTSTVLTLFEVSAAQPSGLAVWSETQALSFHEGLFQITLGASTPLTSSSIPGRDHAFAGAEGVSYELEMTIDGASFPRIPLRRAPLAIDSSRLGGRPAARFVDLDQAQSAALNPGDLLQRGPAQWQRLPLGPEGRVLTVNGGQASWQELPDFVAAAAFGSAEGSLVYKGATGPAPLPPPSSLAQPVLSYAGASPQWRELATIIGASGPGQILATATAGQVSVLSAPSGIARPYLSHNGSSPVWLDLPQGLDESVFGTLNGSLAYRSASGVTALAPPSGSDFQVLSFDSAGAAPRWSALRTALGLNSAGSIPFYDGSSITGLPPAADGLVLTMAAGRPEWRTPTGGGGGTGSPLAYASFKATSLCLGRLTWSPIETSTPAPVSVSSSGTDLSINAGSSGRYLVILSLRPNLGFNRQDSYFKRKSAPSGSSNALLVLRASIQAGNNLVMSQSTSAILNLDPSLGALEVRARGLGNYEALGTNSNTITFVKLSP